MTHRPLKKRGILFGMAVGGLVVVAGSACTGAGDSSGSDGSAISVDTPDAEGSDLDVDGIGGGGGSSLGGASGGFGGSSDSSDGNSNGGAGGSGTDGSQNGGSAGGPGPDDGDAGGGGDEGSDGGDAGGSGGGGSAGSGDAGSAGSGDAGSAGSSGGGSDGGADSGGSAGSEDGSGGNGGSGGTDTDDCPRFRLLGASWDGAEEVVSEIDPEDGSSRELGALGDLTVWSGQLVYDSSRKRVHALGTSDAASVARNLYGLDLRKQRNSQVPVLADDTYALGGVDDSGRLVVAWWDSGLARENVGVMNATSGVVTTMGSFGDLARWNSRLVYDKARNVAYAVGTDEAGASPKLYSCSLATGLSQSVPAASDWELGGALTNGHLVAAYWDGASEVVIAIDPSNGASVALGSLGGLLWWNGQIVVDAKRSTVYALGYNDVETTLYSLNLETGASRNTPIGPNANRFLARQ